VKTAATKLFSKEEGKLKFIIPKLRDAHPERSRSRSPTREVSSPAITRQVFTAMNVLIAVGPQGPMMIQNLDGGPQAQGLIPKNEIFL
jgi:hypothetical protein